MKRLGLGLAGSIFCAACTPTPSRTTPPGEASGTDVTRTYPSARAPDARTGLAHPDNDPEVVKRARAALACPGWESVQLQPDACVDVLGAVLAMPREGKEATFLHLVEDPDLRVVSIGAYGLEKTYEWREAEPRARVVLDVFAARMDEGAYALEDLARVAGLIDGQKTGLEPRMKRLFAELRDVRLRAEFLEAAQRSNQDAFFSITIDVLQNAPEEQLRTAAVAALWTGTPESKRAEVCSLFLARTKDPSDAVAASAADALATRQTTRTEGCNTEHPALIALLEQKTKGNEVTERWVDVVLKAARNSAIDPKHRPALVAMGTRLAENKKNLAYVRIQGLHAVAVVDPPRGKTLAKKLSKDPDGALQLAAQAVLDGDVGG